MVYSREQLVASRNRPARAGTGRGMKQCGKIGEEGPSWVAEKVCNSLAGPTCATGGEGVYSEGSCCFNFLLLHFPLSLKHAFHTPDTCVNALTASRL